MKRTGKVILLTLLLVVVLCISALAANDSGITGLSLAGGVNNVSIKVQKGDDTEISAVNGFYPGAEKLEVTITGDDADTYRLIVLQKRNSDGSEEEVPTQSTIKFIDQRSGNAEKVVVFNVYPQAFESGATYLLKTSSNSEAGGLKTIATFSYVGSTIKKGDVTGEGDVNAVDATEILKYSVGLPSDLTTPERIAAGDVTGEGDTNAVDATEILKYSVGLPSDVQKWN